VSFAATTLCVASQQVFVVFIVYFVKTQSGNFWIHVHTCTVCVLERIKPGIFAVLLALYEFHLAQDEVQWQATVNMVSATKIIYVFQLKLVLGGGGSTLKTVQWI
jgi:hypothetical protein